MKTINLFDKEMSIEKEYEMAVCVWETTASNLDNYEDVEIKLGFMYWKKVKQLKAKSI